MILGGLPDISTSLSGSASVMPVTANVSPNICDAMPDSAIVEHDDGIVGHHNENVLLCTANVVPDSVVVGQYDAIAKHNINESAFNIHKAMKTFYIYNIHTSHFSIFFTLYI